MNHSRWLKSEAELNVYFAQDKLTCLLCGKKYTTLYQHLPMTHKVTATEYQEMFGIPKSRTLFCDALRQHKSQMLRDQIQKKKITRATAVLTAQNSAIVVPTASQRSTRSGRIYRELVVFMRELQGKTWSQIASFLNVHESAVENLYHEMTAKGTLDDHRYWDDGDI
jgi:ROS/MUCR transcriptional regulator protein